MGDMKTPDFDDLLAAFDIPDIDAKEAIQSAPEEVEGHQGSSTFTKSGESGVGGSSTLRVSSPNPDPHSDTSIVSVIVKNRVHTEACEGGDLPVSEPHNHNGLVSSNSSQSHSRDQPNGEQWPLCPSKVNQETTGSVLGSPNISKQNCSILNKLKPLMSQTTGDPVGRVRKMQLLQQQHLHQEITLERGDKTKSTDIPGSTSGVASFFPPHITCSAPSVSSLSVGSQVPGAMAPLPHAVSPTEPLNGTPHHSSSKYKHMGLELEDSDQDSGSSLVIQEGPESPPVTKDRHISPQSSESSSFPYSSMSMPKPVDRGTSISSQSWLSLPTKTEKSSHTEEQNPEHVIEKRDSPESPEPEIGKETKILSALNTSLSPVMISASPSTGFQEPKEEEEEMEVAQKTNEDDRDMTNLKHHENKQKEDENLQVENENRSTESPAVPKSTPNGSRHTGKEPSRPLKVRIKTIKTSTGSITRTVTRVAGKGAAANSGKCSNTKKVHPGRRTVPSNKIRKTEAITGQVLKDSTIPVSTLQASNAMLTALTKAQNKPVLSSDKSKVSVTAVSETNSSSFPGTSTVNGISVLAAAGRAVNGGVLNVHAPCKPASIVNSTGAVISRSQSSLVEAFNKILNSKNLLPSYRPDLTTLPPPEWGLSIPAAGYRCLECGDAFALERSLARHYDRRSLRIEVTCNHCAKRLAFFNKCSLLLHAREHKERGLVMQCSHLVMRPVSVEHMIGLKDTTPIGMHSPLLSSFFPIISANSGTQCVFSNLTPLKDSPSHGTASSQITLARRGAQSPHALMPLASKKCDVLQYHNFKCLECQAQFAGKAELVAHFQQIRATANSTCMLCSPPMMLPNGCSVSAHQRIHKHRAPHVCPECGGIARQTGFQTHLEEACLHFARRIGYRCSSCQVVFGGLSSIKSHIQTAHCEVFHKCPNCPMAFKSSPSAQAHINTQHPTTNAAYAKLIYKCVMCDTVFTQKPLLYMHFDTHLAKQKVHVFKCPECTKLYAQKGSMMEHIKIVHRGLLASRGLSDSSPTDLSPASGTDSTSKTKQLIDNFEEFTQVPGEGAIKEDNGEEKEEEEEDFEQEELSSSSESQSMEWRCKICKTQYCEKEDYIGHMKKEHGMSMKKFPCQMCERSFSSANSLRRHVRVIHEGVKKVFHCPKCSEGKRTFSSRLILEKHIRVRHGIRSKQPLDIQNSLNTRKRSTAPDEAGFSGGDYECAADVTGAQGDETVSSAKRIQLSENRSAAEEVDNGTFRCAPCGFTTLNWEEFLRHISIHCNTDSASQQCMQCGACFASAGSLSRHRFITHRLRRDHQDTQHGAVSPAVSPQDESLSSPKAGEVGECGMSCRVCNRRFDKASDLNTHLRTHGMAFIAAHKADKPM